MLVIIGITLLILLGGDMLSRGSRVTIERAYITGQLLRIATMVIDEAMTSEAGKEKLGESMLFAIAQGGAVPPKSDTAGRDQLINGFLGSITPYNANGVLDDIFPNVAEDEKDPQLPHREPWDSANPDSGNATGMKFWRKNGRVLFGVDALKNAKYTADTLGQAYKAEIDSKTLKLEAVEMRVVAFRACVTQAPPSTPGMIRMPFSAERVMGIGLARAQVKVGWKLPRAVEGKEYTIWRTVTSDRYFDLIAPKVISGTGADGEWTLQMGIEWQRGAVGND